LPEKLWSFERYKYAALSDDSTGKILNAAKAVGERQLNAVLAR
jgi:hypothetical protein